MRAWILAVLAVLGAGPARAECLSEGCYNSLATALAVMVFGVLAFFALGVVATIWLIRRGRGGAAVAIWLGFALLLALLATF